MSRFSPVAVFTFLLAACLPLEIHGHGRMLEPPSRMSAYLAGFPTPPNYEDHQMNCGGISLQWDKNDGRCGMCGDPWSGPRRYERPDGDLLPDTPVITRTYQENESIKVSIQLTMNHKGWFEFRLCDIRDTVGRLKGVEADQDCLDKHLLADDRGRTRFDSPPDPNGVFDFFLVLPAGLTCPNCLLQWKWKCGNNWGCDETGGCAVGNGERQEEFYACSDIKIDPRGGSSPISPQPQPIQPQPIQPQPIQPQPIQPQPIQPQPYPLQPQPYPPQPQPYPSQPYPPQPQPYPSQPEPQPYPPQPRVDIPEGYSSYSEYLQNMFASTTYNALVFTNKVRGPTTPVGTQSNPATRQYDMKFLKEVIGYPSTQTPTPVNPNLPSGMPSWMRRAVPSDEDAVNRLCAACYSSCRFNACVWQCPQLCHA